MRLTQAEEMQTQLLPAQQDFGNAFCALLKSVEPVPVDFLLHDKDELGWCGGCQVVATSGHTPGHIALYLKAHSAIVAGDAIALEDGRPVVANPQFTLDAEGAKASLSHLLGLGAETIYCYHGGIFHQGEQDSMNPIV